MTVEDVGAQVPITRNPFVIPWPPMGKHRRNGCILDLKDFRGSFPEIPPHDEVVGGVVVVGGESGCGKSVYTHKLLHALDNGSYVVDEWVSDERETDLEKWRNQLYPGRVINEVKRSGVRFSEELDRNIDAVHGFDWREWHEALARELAPGKGLLVRLRCVDPTLMVDTVARDVLRFAEAADHLADCVYLYEFHSGGGRRLGELESLVGQHTDRVKVVEVNRWSVADALVFARKRVSEGGLVESSVNWSQLEIILKENAKDGDRLSLTVDDFNRFLRKAFDRAQGSVQVNNDHFVLALEFGGAG
ncbi:hypothetical protein [Rhizohabitans arisaemae]|uniref:hypothetical protein n=1 Tax=Rhizohabitans arisaemae TaxID=2720610 RepID=UPI0024B1264E|nr:hypothetical protein [Rhizohabitans arisaemae]